VKPKTRKNRVSPFFIFFLVLTLLYITGCTSNDEIAPIHRDLARMDREINQLKAQVNQAQKESEGFSEQKYADLQSQIDTVTTELKALDAKTDDILQRLNDTDRQIAQLKQRIQAQDERLANFEKKVTAKQKVKRPVPIASDISGASSPVESMYDDAYLSFTQGNFPEARKKFRAFLKKYPKTAYSDNAYFWIGETYYSEGDFESAILEYEKVIRHYPRGDKVPSALLKEGLSFIKLGDKTDGKLVLRKLVKRFPRSDQAKIARRILHRLK